MTTLKTPEEAREFLTDLGLSPDAPALVDRAPTIPVPDGTSVTSPATGAQLDERRLTPAADIVFDPADLDGFPNLDGAAMAAASRHLFEMYKSPHRDKERHALLHRRIGEFIAQVRRSRKTGGVGGVTEKVKTTKEQRDIAALMAEKGLTAADLAQILKERR